MFHDMQKGPLTIYRGLFFCDRVILRIRALKIKVGFRCGVGLGSSALVGTKGVVSILDDTTPPINTWGA